MKIVEVKVDIGRYKYVTLPLNDALKFIEALSKNVNSHIKDVEEAHRILKNFEVFYESARRKFKNYILIPHTPSDMIKGKVVIDKVKLFKREGGKFVTIVFDRRVDENIIVEVIRKIGFTAQISHESL